MALLVFDLDENIHEQMSIVFCGWFSRYNYT